jgi:hypothetical protein
VAGYRQLAGGQVRILLLAPRTDLLNVDAEVQAVLRSGLDVTPRIGDVRHVDVLTDVTTGEYDVFWHAGHATKDGLVLSDGVLSAEELTPLIRNRFELVVLNSCDSQQTAQMLQNETEASVVATIVEVPDQLAFQTGALFARELARTGDIPTAYQAAKPGNNRTYVLLGWGKKKVVDGRTLDERLDRLEVALNQTQRTLARVVALMDGDPSYHIVGMPDQLAAYIKANEDWKKATEQRVLGAESRIKNLEDSNKPMVITRATLIFMIVLGTVCLVLAFMALTWLQGAG